MKKAEDRNQSRERKMFDFNPDNNGLIEHGIFGLPFTAEESELVIVPVPWDVTVSYRRGTADGPEAVLNASQQIDLFREEYRDIWKNGIALDNIPLKWKETSIELQKLKRKLHKLNNKKISDETRNGLLTNIKQINHACRLLNEWVEQKTATYLDEGRIVGILGGDHSVPLGYLNALAKRHESFGILQIDAHTDLREAYEGFEYSHASVMFNVLKIPQVSKIVQTGIRDYCSAEYNLIKANPDRIVTYTDKRIKASLFSGAKWLDLAIGIINQLPDKVYISFDIDGLQPWLCPNTGTPVPGGLSFEEACFLIETVTNTGRKIIGFDLCEVAPGRDEQDEWDANVGARILYELSCNALLGGKK